MGDHCQHCGGRLHSAPNDALVAAISGLRMGPVSKALLLKLAQHPGEFIETGRLVGAVYDGNARGGPDDATASVRVLLCNARKRLAPLGIDIVGRGGRGNGGYKIEFAEAA